MSEPLTRSGDPSIFGATVKGEKAGNFEEMFSAEDVQEDPVEAAEAPVEAAEPEEGTPDTPEAPEAATEAATAPEEASEDESEGDRLVRETTEALRKQITEAMAAQPEEGEELSEVRSSLAEIKRQIVEAGQKSEAVEEPEDGFDVSILDSPEVQAHLAAARDSDDPAALPKALATIAKHVYESQGSKDVQALRQELEALKQSREIEARRQQNQQVFLAGLKRAEATGDVEAALVRQFSQAKEFEAMTAHATAQGNLEGYAPRSILGLWLMQKPHYAATPELMEDGVRRLALQLKAGRQEQAPAEVSTTGASAPAAASKAGSQLGTHDADPEDEILKSILDAAEQRRTKAAAFM